MSRESAFIDRLRSLATDPAARALADDAAVLTPPGGALVLTHDMLVESVHFLPEDPAGDVAWKLLAVNLSDLAAKGARPLGILVGYGMSGEAAWDAGFAEGLGQALAHFDVPLLGGDTVSMPPGGPRTLGLTAIGAAPPCGAPDRRGARPGDLLFVTGTIGDAGLGLALLQGREQAPDEAHQALLTGACRRPEPPVALGSDLAPQITASADVSDGLLIDTGRIARASGVDIHVDIARVPLSPAYVAARGDGIDSRIAAATSGDDYQLLFTASPEREQEVLAIAKGHGVPLTRIGRCARGEGRLVPERDGAPVPLPGRLGYEHDG